MAQESFLKGNLVIKFSNNYQSLANEIKVLRKIKKKALVLYKEKNKQSPEHFGVPQAQAYNIITVVNPNKNDIREESCFILEEGNIANMFGYYIMPKYKITL